MGSATTFPRVLRSEWIKIRTVKSTWITAIATLLAIIGFGVLSAMVATGDVSGGPGGDGAAMRAMSPLTTVLAGANFAVLIIAVFGSVVGAREFSTGMIRTSFAAVPKRLPVLWAKLLAFCGIVVPIVLIGIVAVFFAGMAVLAGGGAPTVSWDDDGVARSILGTAYYVLGLGLIGLALGLLLRGTAASIGTVIGAVIFLPALATALLPDSWDVVLKYLPSNAGTAFAGSSRGFASLLEPGAGVVVFTAWIVLAIVAAAWALVRRDA